MARKRARYAGILARPIIRETPLTPSDADPDLPPDGWVTRALPSVWQLVAQNLGSEDTNNPPESWLTPTGAGELWRIALETARKRDAKARDELLNPLRQRIVALCEHFGIKQGVHGWSTELLWALALRHEKDLVDDSGRPGYLRLCERECVDPADPQADFQLVLGLARRYVPGFEIREAPRPPGRFTDEQAIALTICVEAVRRHVLRSGSRSPGSEDREVARIICSGRELEAIIPREVAQDIRSILEKTGNMRRGHRQSARAREESVRKLIGEMRTAWPGDLGREPTRFQRQLIDEVWQFWEFLESEITG